MILYKDKIIVPYSASGVGTAQNAKFECCEGRGAVVAVSLRDGRRDASLPISDWISRRSE